MRESQLTVPSEGAGPPLLDPRRDQVLSELQRHGYVAEPSSTPGREVWRHPAAPSLLVHHDGRLELLSGEPEARAPMHFQRSPSQIRWRRGMLFLALLGAATFVGLLLVAMIVG